MLGRNFLIKKNNLVLAGVQTKSLSLGEESVDITSGEDSGFRLLENESGQRQIDISVDGILKDTTLKDIALDPVATKMLTDITLEWEVIESGNTTGATISGNFRLSSFEISGSYNEAVTFSCSLESSGAWIYTAEA